MSKQKSSSQAKEKAAQKKAAQPKKNKRTPTAPEQVNADVQLLQRKLGNDAMAQMMAGSREKTKEENGRSLQSDIGQIMGRGETAVQRELVQRGPNDPQDKRVHQGVTMAANAADPYGSTADQTSAQYDHRLAHMDSKSEAAKEMSADKTNLDIVAGGSDTLAGLQAISAAWQNYKAGKLDTSGKLEAAEGGAKAVAGGAKVVDSSAKSKGSETGVGASDMVGKATGLIADSLSTVKESFTLFKDSWSQFRQAKKMKKMNPRDAVGLMQTASKGLQAGFKMAKGWYDVLGSKVPTDILAGIPALGIIVSGLDVMLRAYDFFKAYRSEQALGQIDQQQAVARHQDSSKEQDLRAELHKIGVKREKRAGTDITRGLMSIVGDILNLTGVGIAAGTGMKVAAGVSGAVQTTGRGLKQWARDKAASGSKLANAIANPAKSTAAKAFTREHHSNIILDMLVRSQNGAQLKRVETYVEAAGSSFDEMADIARSNQQDWATMISELMGNLSGAMAKR